MSDIGDLAEKAEAAERDRALKRLRDSIDWCEPQMLDGAVVVCRDCLEPIQIERLRANPRAARCVDCQIDFERQQKMEGA